MNFPEKKKVIMYGSKVFMHARIRITDRIKNSLGSGLIYVPYIPTSTYHNNYLRTATIRHFPHVWKSTFWFQYINEII